MVAAPTGDDATSVAAWEAAVARAKVAVEAQAAHAMNLDLMARYGVEAWKNSALQVDKLVDGMKARVAAVKSEVDSVNASRRQVQEAVAPRLAGAAATWLTAVDATLQVQLACADASAEVARLRAIARDKGLLADAESEDEDASSSVLVE
ncbi:MAG: hypothetical protein EOO41_01800 [Methanobacteriota archaeon]|nr:MAG: hypothetical protein EOO41_01800 [Euryarchaeota archaeon]